MGATAAGDGVGPGTGKSESLVEDVRQGRQDAGVSGDILTIGGSSTGGALWGSTISVLVTEVLIFNGRDRGFMVGRLQLLGSEVRKGLSLGSFCFASTAVDTDDLDVGDAWLSTCGVQNDGRSVRMDSGRVSDSVVVDMVTGAWESWSW